MGSGVQGTSEDGSFENAVGAKGGGSAQRPHHVLGPGAVLQDEVGVGRGDQGGHRLEAEHGVRLVQAIESHLFKG